MYSSLKDFPINEPALSGDVFGNDTAIKTYLSNIHNKDKVSPWSVWSETYFCPYVGRMETPKSGNDGKFVFSSLDEVRHLPYWKGKVLEPNGRIFLGGDVYVTRSARFKQTDIATILPEDILYSSDTDRMLVHMQKSGNEDQTGPSSLSGGESALLVENQTNVGVKGDLASYFRKKARSRERGSVSFLSDPRIYSNKPSLREFSFSIPVDGNYIGQGEYWSLYMEPFSSVTNNYFVAGSQTVVGWEGVSINLRFASLLEE
tara:strand:+ start:1104 stop:1883 length:780 start_codon:yes stop_codon:yes gene_type:complete